MNNPSSSPGSARFPTFAPFFRWVLSLPSKFPALARVFRWLFSWRTLGRALAGLAVLATLIALVCAEETWRGKRAWQNYKRQLEAQGEKLDWKDYVPPPVPDHQNFAMTPFLAPLFDFNPRPWTNGQSRWRDPKGFERATSLQRELALEPEITRRNDPCRTSLRMTDLQAWARGLAPKTNPPPHTAAEPFLIRYGLDNPAVAPPGPAAKQPPAPPPDAAAAALARREAAAQVLRALEKYQPVLEELRSASQRPYARFNIDYDDFVYSILLPHLPVVKGGSLLFQLQASAELALDRTDQAWLDTKMALYLPDTLKGETFLISKLVQASLVQLALQPIWEGLAERKWSDAQLAEIEQRLGKLDLLADAALRGERAWALYAVDQVRHVGMLDPLDGSSSVGPAAFLLGGFYYQNQLFLARMYQRFFVPVVDAANQRVYPSRAPANEAVVTNALAGGFKPYRVFAQITLRELVSAQPTFAFDQTRVNEAIVACALERYRLAERQFPESLEPLAPRFLAKLPHDVITGEPLIYRRTSDGQFILYSVGWNERDDGGTVVVLQPKLMNPDITRGDWVWQYPAPAVSAVQEAAPE